MVDDPLACGPTVVVCGVSLRLLGLELTADGREIYEVVHASTAESPWRPGRLSPVGGATWALVDARGARVASLELGEPDHVFALAGGRTLDPDAVAHALGHWPVELQERLARRGVTGACSLAFDAAWFLDRLTRSPMDTPLHFPGAAGKLGLERLSQATEVLRAAADTPHSDAGLIGLLQRGLEGSRAQVPELRWLGDGRLIGESTWGDLSQVGDDIADGCRRAQGTGPLCVRFEPHEPMGLGFGPAVPSADILAGWEPEEGASVGSGVEVGEVEARGAAARAGVATGMVVVGLSGAGIHASRRDMAAPFEHILGAVDALRDTGKPVELTFRTAAPLTHWYAVELPAANVLASFGCEARGPAGNDVGVGESFDALCGDALLWREPTPRVFLGAPGSVTCAHVDICPQVQLAHGLLGVKVLGMASHAATARLSVAHGGREDDDSAFDEGATHVPVDRPLSPRQAQLLGDADVSLIWLGEGDLTAFHSGALHFASNGADGLSASLYHGIITEAGLPRLRAAAAAPDGRGASGGAYGGHLYAADLLKLVEARLRATE